MKIIEKPKEKEMSIVSKNKTFILLFLLLIIIFGTWVFAFYPGNLSPDSIVLYSQALTFKFDSIHPYLFSVFLSFLTKIWSSPAVLIIFQTLLSAFIGAYVFNLFYINKLSKRVIALLFAFFITSVPIALYNVTFWNDIVYTQMIFLVSLIFVNFGLIKKGKVTNNYVLGILVLLAVLISSFRYNGIIYLLLVPGLFYVYKLLTKKQALIIFFMATFIFLLQSTVLSGLLKVNKSNSLLKEIPKVKIIGSVLKDNGKVTEVNGKVFYNIAPKEVWANYVCYNDYSLFWNKDFNSKFFENVENEKSWNKAFLNTAVGNPISAFKDRACLDTYLLAGQNMNYLGISENGLGLAQKDTLVRKYLTTIVNFSVKKPFRFIVWAPIVYITICGIFTYLSLKNKTFWTLGFIILNYANIILIFLIVSSAEFRYLYSSVFPVFFIPGFYLIEKRLTGNKLI